MMICIEGVTLDFTPTKKCFLKNVLILSLYIYISIFVSIIDCEPIFLLGLIPQKYYEKKKKI